MHAGRSLRTDEAFVAVRPAPPCLPFSAACGICAAEVCTAFCAAAGDAADAARGLQDQDRAVPSDAWSAPRPSLAPPPLPVPTRHGLTERSWAAAPPTIVLKDASGNTQVLEGQADGVSPCHTASDRHQIHPACRCHRIPPAPRNGPHSRCLAFAAVVEAADELGLLEKTPAHLRSGPTAVPSAADASLRAYKPLTGSPCPAASGQSSAAEREGFQPLQIGESDDFEPAEHTPHPCAPSPPSWNLLPSLRIAASSLCVVRAVAEDGAHWAIERLKAVNVPKISKPSLKDVKGTPASHTRLPVRKLSLMCGPGC